MEVHLIRSFAHYKRAGRGTPLRQLTDSDSPFKCISSIRTIKLSSLIPELNRFIHLEMNFDRFSSSRVIYGSKAESQSLNLLVDQIVVRCAEDDLQGYIYRMTLDYLGQQYCSEEFALDKQFSLNPNVPGKFEYPFSKCQQNQQVNFCLHLTYVLRKIAQDLQLIPLPSKPLVMGYFGEWAIEHPGRGSIYLHQNHFVTSLKELTYQRLCRQCPNQVHREFLLVRSLSYFFDFFTILTPNLDTMKPLSDRDICRYMPHSVINMFSLYWKVYAFYGHEDRKFDFMRYYTDFSRSLKKCYKSNGRKRRKGSLQNLDRWILFADQFLQLFDHVDETSDISFAIWEIAKYLSRSAIPSNILVSLSGHFVKVDADRTTELVHPSFTALTGFAIPLPALPTRSQEPAHYGSTYWRTSQMAPRLMQGRLTFTSSEKLVPTLRFQGDLVFQMGNNLTLRLPAEQKKLQLVESRTGKILTSSSIVRIMVHPTASLSDIDCKLLAGYNQKPVVTLGNCNDYASATLQSMMRVVLEANPSTGKYEVVVTAKPVIGDCFRAEARWGSRFLRLFQTESRRIHYQITRLTKKGGIWSECQEDNGDLRDAISFKSEDDPQMVSVFTPNQERQFRINNQHAVLASIKPYRYGSWGHHLVAWDYTKMSETNPQTPIVFHRDDIPVTGPKPHHALFLGRSGAFYYVYLRGNTPVTNPLYGLVAFHQGKFAELVTERPLFKSPLPASFSAGQHVVQFDARHLRLLFWWSEKRWVPFREGEDRGGSPEDGRFEFYAHVKVAKFLF